MSFIGLDLGTSFIKGAVLDLDGRRLDHVRRVPFPRQSTGVNPLFCEFHPAEIVAAVRLLLDELAPYASHCEGIVMCSQMHAMVLVDSQGEARSNCLSWRDQRGTAPHPSGEGSYSDVMVRRTTSQQRKQLGNELGPGRPICFLFWFAEQGKLAPGLIPASMPDFVVGALCRSSPGTEITNAGAYGAFNLEKSDWHHEVIQQLGLSHLRWLALRQQGEVVGRLPLSGRLVPCYAPVGDYQCALLGALLSTEELSLNISTGSQVSRLTPLLELGDQFQTRPFFDGKFLNTFTTLPSGRSLDVLVNLVNELASAQNPDPRDPWAYIAEATRKVTDTDVKADLSFFAGLDAEGGSISNIRGKNLTVGSLFRAAFKDMAENYYSCALQLWPARSWSNLAFSGGLASKIEALRDTVQERFQTGYRLCPSPEDTLFGLLILASVFSGKADSIEALTQELRAGCPRLAEAKH